ncbi:MAG: membrane protein insertion efficiency factor YidD [Candidatus Omnitrophica bacterium]|nr:membrane protein insertion efficiency factor YidD [Candidatus Omnitrophota bacterium]
MLRSIPVLFLTWYQRYLRGVLPASCRFSPSCSEYCIQAFRKYGLIKGAAKGMSRIIACHPFSGRSGYDPLK